MSKNKNKQPFDWKNMTPEEKLKFEIAEELGLGDKVINGGWKSLTSKESGRIGGLITKRKREMKQKGNEKAGIERKRLIAYNSRALSGQKKQRPIRKQAGNSRRYHGRKKTAEKWIYHRNLRRGRRDGGCTGSGRRQKKRICFADDSRRPGSSV